MNTASFQPLLCRSPGCSCVCGYVRNIDDDKQECGWCGEFNSIDMDMLVTLCPDCYEDMKAKEEIQAAENHVISNPDPFGLITNPLGQCCPSDIDPTPPSDDWYYR